jgi:hypothetical protein
MIRVDFDPESLSSEQKQWFDNWCKLAEAATKRLANDQQLRPKIWGTLKQWLLTNFFYGKCAYCENNIEGGFVGDAEHYRPKGAVTEMRDGRLVRVERDGQPHRGYYWLAYDWRNLIPSCERCNAVHGKRTQFPVVGNRVFDETVGPDTKTLNSLEKPLLLHPYPDDPDDPDDPADHIVFTPDGKVVGRDEKGEKSIEILDLNRDGLVNLRRDWIWAQRGRFASDAVPVLANAAVADVSAKINEIISSLTSPDRVFSAAIRDVLSAVRSQLNVK